MEWCKDYTAEMTRVWDYEIDLMVIQKILEKLDGQEFCGEKQIGKGSFYSRRWAEDNAIALDKPFGEAVNHLRTCEK